jgi:hypothetical protein
MISSEITSNHTHERSSCCWCRWQFGQHRGFFNVLQRPRNTVSPGKRSTQLYNRMLSLEHARRGRSSNTVVWAAALTFIACSALATSTSAPTRTGRRHGDISPLSSEPAMESSGQRPVSWPFRNDIGKVRPSLQKSWSSTGESSSLGLPSTLNLDSSLNLTRMAVAAVSQQLADYFR